MTRLTATLRKRLDTTLEAALVGIFALLVIDVLWQVIARYLPLPLPAAATAFTEELARALLLWLAVLGAAYAQGRHAHLSLDLFTESLGPNARQLLARFADAAAACFAIVVLGVGGGLLVLLSAELKQIAPSLGIPFAAVYSALPLGGLAMTAYAMLNVLDASRSASPSASPSESKSNAQDNAPNDTPSSPNPTHHPERRR